MKTVVLVMAGGKGERFYPASRNNYPKQFLCLLNDDESMIQKTVNRVLPIVDKEDVYILTNILYKDEVKKHLPFAKEENIVLEPSARNTAPAIELGIEKVKEKYEDALIVVLPSDQLIKDEANFLATLKLGIEYASNNDALITIGIKPTEPNTGYGYIKLSDSNKVSKVNRFVEKPNLEKAKEYLNEGDYVWNAGMFIFSLKNIDKAFKTYLPNQYDILSKDTSKFNDVEPISIDYGIMEKANNIYCVKGDFGWDDVGSWLSLERNNVQDKNGNTVLNKDVILLDSTNNIIKGKNNKLIATLGVNDLVIVEDDDVILIAKKDKVSNIKEIIKTLKEEKKDKYI